MANKNLVRVYSDRNYVYTTMVRHQGTTVAFAMDGSRRIYYSVLNLDLGSRERGEIDSSYWDDNPPLLTFPSEVTEVGFGVGETVGVPAVRLGGRAEVDGGLQLQAEDLDPFLSTTARLGGQAPFQVVSDGRYLMLFRQSVDETHPDALFRLAGGGASGDASRTDYAQVGGAKVPLVSSTVLCDRFVQVGATVKPVLEVRYRRSRSKTSPASSSDTLGTRDLDGKPFYEPTRKLSFVRNVADGEIAVLLLPTQVNDVMRWQLFAVNKVTGRIDGFNVERADDGLFNLAGTQFYTSPDPRYAGSVLEREPGADPFTNKPLVPVPLPTDRAGTALRLDGQDDHLDLGSAPSARLQGAYTVEAWVNPAAAGGAIVAAGDGAQAGSFTLRMTSARALVLTHPGTGNTISAPDGTVPLNRYSHVAAVFGGDTPVKGRLYVDGVEVANGAMSFTPSSSGVASYVGARRSGTSAAEFFRGDIDEVRIWSQARPVGDLARDFRRRLAGVEPGLVAYYRFDEGAGSSVADHTDNGFDGTVRGGAVWVTSGAPVGDSPGLSRETFGFAGRSLSSGVAAVLYFQQEETVAGYADQPSPAKRQARVLLACPTVETAAPGGDPLLATLDLALAADGRLARVPRSVVLSTIGRPDPTKDMDMLSAAQEAVTAAQAKLIADQHLLDLADQAVRDAQPGYEYWNNRYWAFVNSGYCYDEGSFVWPHERSGRADGLLALLGMAAAPYNAALRSRDDATAQLARDRTVLAERQAALAALSGGLQGGDDVTLAMPVVAVDSIGLSVFGAVLAFAWSRNTPALLDSSTGEVVLYFRGVDGQFFSVYYDVTASRAAKQLTFPSGRLALTSRDTGVALSELGIVVSAGPDAARCTVTVTRTANNTTYTETFNGVPRRADQFAAALTGTPTGDLLGTVVSIQGNTVTLAAPLPAALAAGTKVRVAGAVYQVRDSVPAVSSFTLTTNPGTVGAGAQVRTVVYDYASATSSRPGARLDAGSLIVAVDAGTATDAVPNGTAADVVAGRGNHWRGNAPGRAFSFDGTKRLALPAAQRARAAMAGDLTLEAWANPGFASAQSRILHANLPGTPATRYTLGVSNAPYLSALEFNGSGDSLDCGTGIDLTSTSFTVEFWIKRLASGRSDYIVGLGTTNTTDQSLHIGFRDSNAFTFAFWNDDVDVSTSYSDQNWHHWACVYDREGTNRTQIVYRDGVEVARRPATGHFAGTGKLLIAQAGGNRAYAQVDEVRVWGRARSVEEVKANKDRRLTGRETGLLGYWTFPGRQTTDRTGRGNDATITGNPRLVASNLPGYRIFAGVGDQLVRSRDAYPAGQWGHLVAAFEQDWALRLEAPLGWTPPAPTPSTS
ncbi:LamG domain-containing protein [Micromonospora olivasterospora]|uniref:Concanavalin A-like lectin/glucanase superfamily protein n=1 Tax=Micromonospora olivasterospora TaxID=1880 RepID=A0A562IJS8_MICOL|nr:LamG domain-containing protein [Micromonospora olivasterospora]TWH70985.1 concanavalin A-like lectin/glucanase superfamily protein [Micromonospora olivasterospora]